MRPDQTFLCPKCALRSGPVSVCPECGKAPADLRIESERSRALSELPTKQSGLVRLIPPEGCMVALIVTFIVVATFVGMGVGVFLAGGVGFILGFLIPPIGFTVIWMLWLPEAQNLRDRFPKYRVPVRVAPPPATAPSAERSSYSGVVAASEKTLRSPVTRSECIAYRVVGNAGNIAIDDADATSFAVETEEGTIQVEAPPATVHIPITSDECEVHDAKLLPWLRDRGAEPAARCKLAEALLLPGDVVEVEASPTPTHEGAGYRSQRTVILLKELPGSPLSIRVTKRN